MIRKAGIAAALLLAASSLYAQAGSLDQARTELSDAEKLLLYQQLDYPPCGREAELGAELTKKVAKVGVTNFKFTPAASTEVPQTPVRLERLQVSGSGEWGDVESAIHRMAALRIGRIADFESMHLQALDDGNVSFDGVVATACWDGDSKALDVAMPRAGSVNEIAGAMYAERTKKIRATIAAMQGLDQRMQPMRFFDAVIRLADAWYGSAIRVRDLGYTVPAFTIHGVALGAGGRAAVETALHQPGYERTQIDWSEGGDCDGFTATARLNASAPPRGEALGMPIITRETCAPMPAKAAVSIAKRGSGTITLHLHNVELGPLFLALNNASPKHGFVIDSGLSARVSADFDNVTMDEALAAIRASGAAFPSAGPLHRVCKQECPATPAKNFTGEPISFNVVDADIIDILRTFEQITGLHIHGPRDLRGIVSIEVTDVPWVAVFETVFAGLHQSYVIDGDDFYIGDRAKNIPVADIPTSAVRESGLSIADPRKMSVDDLRLAGIAGANGTWTAYARVPGSATRIVMLTPESKFADGSVTAVAADRVTLRTSAGREVILKLE